MLIGYGPRYANKTRNKIEEIAWESKEDESCKVY